MRFTRPRNVLFLVLLSCLLTAAGGVAPAWAAWHPLAGAKSAAPTPPAVTAAGPPAAVTVEFSLEGLDIARVTVGGAEYSVVRLPDASPLLRRGEPELPVVARTVALPERGRPQVKVVEAQWEEIPAPPPLPSKGNLTRDVDPATVPLTFGPVYGGDGVYPEQPAALGRPFVLRDVRGVSLRLFPVRYDFARGVLQVLRRAVVEITTTGDGGENPLTITHRGVDPQFARIYRRLLLNDTAAKYATVAEPGRMLVVTADAYQGAVAPFVEWKRQRGLPVEVITTSSVGGTAAGIQAAIASRYAEPEGLTYVVLVGDIDDVPTNSGTYEGADSDPIYGMVAGDDLYPDLFVSRISAQNATEVQIQVNKFIRYERDPDTGAAATWYHRATGIASNEGSPTDYERCDLLRDDLLNYTFTLVDQIYQPTGTTADITAALNDGRSLINYLGHGSGTSWASVTFTNSDVAALTNGWAHPWILDVSCSNGDFSLATCFAEAWLRAGTPAQPTGAVATYSASTSAAWVPPTVMQAHAVDLLVGEQANTLGALYFYGGMQVLDDYPGDEGHQLIEQYNIFGDCSLVVRTDEPTAPLVSHDAFVPLGAASFTVETGVPGAMAALSRDGQLLGSATADAAGTAVIPLDPPVTEAGDLTLTVTGYNLVPVIETVPAIAPSVVTVAPDTIVALQPDTLVVTVHDADGVTPLPGVDVWAEGLDYATAPVPTDSLGVARLAVQYAYGPSLDVVGRRAGDGYDLFRVSITVLAQPLTAPDLWVTTDIGLADRFPRNLPAVLHGAAADSGVVLHAVLPSGADSVTTDSVLTLTVPDDGEVTGILARPGCDLYTETFPVIVPYGTLAGTVTADGAPAAGATVTALSGGSEVFQVVTGADGAYAAPDSLPVDTYHLTVSLFGYVTAEEDVFVAYGANVHDIDLAPAPTGVLSGTVTDADSGAPLAAAVEVRRADTGELYATADADSTTGQYAVPDLPFADYAVTWRAFHYRPLVQTVTIDSAAVVRDAALTPVAGNILIVDDDAVAKSVAPDKRDPKTGHVIAPGYVQPTRRSADTLQARLEALGYAVTVEAAAVTDPTAWPGYDLLVVACGDNTSPLSDTALRTALVDYTTAGGHLLLEGGEVAYSHNGDAAFAADVMHVSAWNGDQSGDLVVSDPGHAVASTPQSLPSPLPVSYAGYGDQDAVTPAADAALPLTWSAAASEGGVVCFDPNPAPEGGQIVFFTFDFAAADSAGGAALLENAVTWLLTPEVGDAAVSGTVTLPGSPADGVTVTASPGGGSVVTAADGTYQLTGLFAGTYIIRAAKPGWTTVADTVTLAAGEELAGVDFTLYRTTETTLCADPALAIPDNDSAGVADTLWVSAPGQTVSEVAVRVDITHTYQGDLVVELVSPAGTVVTLHDRTGGSTDDIHLWYPDDAAPAGDLSVLAGQPADGAWILRVRDQASYDTGTLDHWCVRLTLPDYTTGVTEAPRRLALAPASPNPFNPSTRLAFALPQAGEVSLRIYDAAGRLVRTLVAGRLPAGEHRVVWRGRDDGGRSVAAGVYFARLRTGAGERITKLSLVK